MHCTAMQGRVGATACHSAPRGTPFWTCWAPIVTRIPRAGLGNPGVCQAHARGIGRTTCRAAGGQRHGAGGPAGRRQPLPDGLDGPQTAPVRNGDLVALPFLVGLGTADGNSITVID
jgi:hypothetical protein